MEDRSDRSDQSGWYYDYSLCESSSADSDDNGNGNDHGKDSDDDDQGQTGQTSQSESDTEAHMPNHVHLDGDGIGETSHDSIASPIADAAASYGVGSASAVDSGEQTNVRQVLDLLSMSMNLPERRQQVEKQDKPDSLNGEWASPDRAAGPQTPSISSRSSTRSSSPDSSGFPRRSSSLPAPSDGADGDAGVDGTSSPALYSFAAPPTSTGLDSCPACIVAGRCSCCGELLRWKRRRCHGRCSE